MEEGKAYVVKKQAEKDLYMRTKKAKANLMVKLAEAKKTDLKNKALQVRGSDRMVGLKMADVYKGLDVIIIPSSGKDGINPLNLNETLEIFGVKTRGKGVAK